MQFATQMVRKKIKRDTTGIRQTLVILYYKNLDNYTTLKHQYD